MKDNLFPHDWQELSAYLDRQLKAEAKARLERRLENEPALRSALQDLRWTKSVLHSQQPLRAPRNFILTAEMVGSRQRPPAYPAMRLVAALASLVLIVLLVGDFLSNQIAPAPLSIAQRNAAAVMSKSAPYPAQQTELPSFEAAPLAVAPPPADAFPTEISGNGTEVAATKQTAVSVASSLNKAPKLSNESSTETPVAIVTIPEATAPSDNVAQAGETATPVPLFAAVPFNAIGTPTETFTITPGKPGVASTSEEVAAGALTETATPIDTFTVTPTITPTLEMTPTPTITPTLTLTPTPTITPTLELTSLPTEAPLILMITALPTDTPIATSTATFTKVPRKRPTKAASGSLSATATQPLEAVPIEITESAGAILQETPSFPAEMPAPLLPGETATSTPNESPVAAILQPTGAYPFPTAPVNIAVVQAESVTPRIFGVERNQWRGLEILMALIALSAGLAWFIMRRR